MPSDRLTQQWREEHCRDGDALLLRAHRLVDDEAWPHAERLSQAAALAAMASAHYAAANVRARPGLSAADQEGLDLAKKWLGVPERPS
jgi:hypothetical protein